VATRLGQPPEPLPVSDSPAHAAPALPAGRLILASGSPRRRTLLSQAGLEFEIRPPDIDEQALPGEGPEALVIRLAEAKAGAVADALEANARRWILGSDTVVVLGEEIIGKPRDPEDAVRMLQRLTGHTHRVLTGVAVIDAQDRRIRSQAVESQVVMRPAEETEIRNYVATGEPLDKAGAYALQGEGRRFVSQVRGSESNVIGLPMEETLALLSQAARDEKPDEAQGDA